MQVESEHDTPGVDLRCEVVEMDLLKNIYKFVPVYKVNSYSSILPMWAIPWFTPKKGIVTHQPMIGESQL